jgi:hypothetical protein
MDYRLRSIPPALWRRVRARAGERLREVLLGLLRLYADGDVDPLDPTSPASTLAAKGGRARADAMTPEERSAAARKAVEARWSKRDTDT